jgi:hypothetical protein
MAVLGAAGAKVPTVLNPGVLANRKGTFDSKNTLLYASGVRTSIDFTGTGSTTVLNIAGSGVFQFGCLTSTAGGPASNGNVKVTIDGVLVANDSHIIYYNEGILSAGNIQTGTHYQNVQYDHYPFNSSLLIVCTNSLGTGSYVAKYYLT